MRRLAELLGALLTVTLASQGCTANGERSPRVEARALPLAGATASSQPEAPAAPPRLVFQVSARYPASVAYALDQAAASRVPDARYREWLLGRGSAKVPSWFAEYAAQRNDWQTSRHGPDGSYDAYSACSYGADTLAALLECAELVLTPSELALAQTALGEADVLLRQHWPVLEPVLQRWQRELAAIASGPRGSGLAQELARSARLPEGKQLTFEVVLVAKPRSNASRAHQAGNHLVVEVSDDREPSSQAHVLFHEIAHLAQKHAPGRAALERAFTGRGARGVVAANLWTEAFATAFGNGLAAEQLDPRFTPERSFYQDEAIDVLGRALYRRWRAGAAITLDASLAEHMLQIVDSHWPRERWRLEDVTRQLVVFSDDRAAAAQVRRGLRPSSLYSYVPVPEELAVPTAAARPVPRLVVATLSTLQQRPDVLRLFGLSPASARARVAEQGASLLWSDTADGGAMLLTAASRAQLRDAAQALSELSLAPTPGWTSLRTGRQPQSTRR